MRILKLLNKKNLSTILFFLFFGLGSHSQEPENIWDIEKNQKIKESVINNSTKKKNTHQNTIYEMQSEKVKDLNIKEDQILASKEIEIIGLYDPSENGLDINM